MSWAATIFSVMPPIGPTAPSASIVPGAGHDRAAGQVVVPDEVEDAEGQHQAGRRAADVLDVDVDVERRRRAAARTLTPSSEPSRSVAAFVVISSRCRGCPRRV